MDTLSLFTFGGGKSCKLDLLLIAPARAAMDTEADEEGKKGKGFKSLELTIDATIEEGSELFNELTVETPELTTLDDEAVGDVDVDGDDDDDDEDVSVDVAVDVELELEAIAAAAATANNRSQSSAA